LGKKKFWKALKTFGKPNSLKEEEGKFLIALKGRKEFNKDCQEGFKSQERRINKPGLGRKGLEGLKVFKPKNKNLKEERVSATSIILEKQLEEKMEA